MRGRLAGVACGARLGVLSVFRHPKAQVVPVTHPATGAQPGPEMRRRPAGGAAVLPHDAVELLLRVQRVLELGLGDVADFELVVLFDRYPAVSSSDFA